ncbi:MAG: DUF1934 family protein [Candidatus Izemoplasmataceae bacterium]
MSKIKLHFSLKTQDEEIQFDTIGLLDNKQLLFHDDSGFKHKLIINNHRIVYQKSGESMLHLILQENHTHQGFYEVMNHRLSFDILTDKLDINNNNIYISYRLITDSELAHKAQLSIEYSMLEEDKHGRN